MCFYKSNGNILLIGIIFLFLGGASILYSLTNFGNYYENITTYEQAYGTIMDVYNQRQYSENYNMEELTICEFRYIVNNELYVNKNIIKKKQFEVGNNVTIFYTNDEPNKGFIMTDNISLYTIVGIVGLILFGSGVGIILIGLNAKEVIVFQQNNNEINMNNLEWNKKLKEIREREIYNNQRVLSSCQQKKENQNEFLNELNNVIEEINNNQNDFY